MIRAFFTALLTSAPKAKPVDLQKFDDARASLHKISKALAKEADAFGDMVRDMRGDKPKDSTSRKKPCAKKRKPRS